MQPGDLTRSKSELMLENALLQQQLIVLQRQEIQSPTKGYHVHTGAKHRVYNRRACVPQLLSILQRR